MSAMPLRAPARVPSGAPDRTPPRTPARGAEPGRSPLTPPAARSAAVGRLRIVRAPAHPRARVPFVVLCVCVLAGALLGALLLNTSMAHTSFVIQERQVQLARLSERQQDLAQQVERAASPQVLAERARAAGMVPAPAPAFVLLSDGTIIGEPTPAGAG
jgi:hypothetical protein